MLFIIVQPRTRVFNQRGVRGVVNKRKDFGYEVEFCLDLEILLRPFLFMKHLHSEGNFLANPAGTALLDACTIHAHHHYLFFQSSSIESYSLV